MIQSKLLSLLFFTSAFFLWFVYAELTLNVHVREGYNTQFVCLSVVLSHNSASAISVRTISSITRTNRGDAVVKGKEPYIPWIISLYKNVCVVMGCLYTCFTI